MVKPEQVNIKDDDFNYSLYIPIEKLSTLEQGDLKYKHLRTTKKLKPFRRENIVRSDQKQRFSSHLGTGILKVPWIPNKRRQLQNPKNKNFPKQLR